ncbi:MAG: Tol-Pal system beta propeller repeat protein TolB [Pseudomonadota bacterium]
MSSLRTRSHHRRISDHYQAFGFAVLALLLGAIGFAGAPARAVLEVDVTRGYLEPLPVAIPDFAVPFPATTSEGALAEISRKLAEVVGEDLGRSGLFRAVDRSAFLEANPDPRRPVFARWNAIGAQALLTGQLVVRNDGNLQLEVRLWDVVAQTQMTGFRYVAPPRNWRRVAHLVADAVYERLTGEKGYFDSQIVYVAETGPKTSPKKQLAIMDQDGANHRLLTSGRNNVILPRFSPSQQEIVYLSLIEAEKRWRAFLYNLDSRKHETLGSFNSSTLAPRFSPEGNQMVLSIGNSGNVDVFLLDLPTRKTTRLTTDPSIDSSPSFSADGERIVFESDRSGSQQLYTMNVNGRDIRRISRGDGVYGTPVWSPRGDLIAFTKIRRGEFQIGVMRPDGTGERILTTGAKDEGPTWSPNGRVLMFFRSKPFLSDGSGGDTSLWSVDLTGYNLRQIPTPFGASDPAWSPLID